MAKKLGFESFIPMGYLRCRRFDYTAKDLEVFRKQVREDHCPAAEGAQMSARKRPSASSISIITMNLDLPDGIRSGSVIRNTWVGEAWWKMYRELEGESGEFFDFMIEHELF